MFPGVVKFENDQYFMRDGHYQWSKESMPAAITWCTEMCRIALDRGMDVVVCNTFTKRKFVEAYKSFVEEAGAEFIVYRCRGHFQNVHGLTDEMVRGFEKAMEDWPGEIIVDPPAEKLK